MKPTLLILAAGMGTRYGALKQMDAVGPSGEAIIDYSIYDAVRAGFGKVVFVIRNGFANEFKKVFNKERFGGKIDVDYAFQEMDSLPDGFSVPKDRIKPWGTNHAVLMAQNIINEPFAVINADDFYGKEAYQVVGNYLKLVDKHSEHYCMVSYQLKNTLSEFGTVSRGICKTDKKNNLVSIVEQTTLKRLPDGKIIYSDDLGSHVVDENTPVSMNLFGFTPDFFEYSNIEFQVFLNNSQNLQNTKSEFFIPLTVNNLIKKGLVELKVLESDAQWFGVTYIEDKPKVMRKIAELIAGGVYPSNLWQ